MENKPKDWVFIWAVSWIFTSIYRKKLKDWVVWIEGDQSDHEKERTGREKGHTPDRGGQDID